MKKNGPPSWFTHTLVCICGAIGGILLSGSIFVHVKHNLELQYEQEVKSIDSYKESLTYQYLSYIWMQCAKDPHRGNFKF